MKTGICLCSIAVSIAIIEGMEWLRIATTVAEAGP